MQLREYLCKWVADEKYNQAFDLWVRYFYETETYDRQICRAIHDETGDAMPVTNHERTLTNRNAIRLMKWYSLLAEQLKIDNKTWTKAKEEALRLTYKGLQELYHKQECDID